MSNARSGQVFEILVVEDNPADAEVIKFAFGMCRDVETEITVLEDSRDAVRYLYGMGKLRTRKSRTSSFSTITCRRTAGGSRRDQRQSGPDHSDHRANGIGEPPANRRDLSGACELLLLKAQQPRRHARRHLRDRKPLVEEVDDTFEKAPSESVRIGLLRGLSRVLATEQVASA